MKKYYEEKLENPGRRDFLKYVPIIVYSLYEIACKSPEGPDIDLKPATEIEGRAAIKDAANIVMLEKGYKYEIKYDVNFYTNKQGRYDVGIFADRNNDGQYDLRLGMNYVITEEGESRQNLNDTATYKFKEIVKIDLTTKSYLTEEFKKWMKDVA